MKVVDITKIDMKEMEIDLETRSSVDLTKCGVYKYAESPDFEILLFGVSIDGSPVKVYDLISQECLPKDILKGIVSNDVLKYAHNASFERVCLSYWLRRNYPEYFRGYGSPDDPTSYYLNPESWRCTMILAAYNGLPLALGQVGEALRFDQQKLKEGRDLIRYFCTPSKSSGRQWNLPEHSPDGWSLFKQYNARDVEVEQQIRKRLENHPVPEFIWKQYQLDQEINDRGIMIDREMVGKAIEVDTLSREKLIKKMKDKTGLDNPNSVQQLKGYLAEHGIKADSLGKKDVAALIKTSPREIAEVLELRLQLAKSSVKKYLAMQNAVCKDNRCHGMFQFYGANRTGRWAGRLIQLQNLPQNHMPDLEQARVLVKQGNYEILEMLYDSVPGTLSELIRTAFIPRPGYKFIVADFSAIEARVLSYLAGEEWRSEVFRTGGDIYCASASEMFKVPVEKNGINGHLRQKGKIAELALGYGGSVGALTAMGALEMGLKEEELQPLVEMWRNSNHRIVNYWWEIDAAVKRAIIDGKETQIGDVRVYRKFKMLFIELPSGRILSYVKPGITTNRFGGQSIEYYGLNAAKKWAVIESYGPKFVENIVQAISRDLLAYALNNLKQFMIVGHVHDEVIIEAPMETEVEELCDIMGQSPEWMPDICLRADGYQCDYYQKD